MLQLLISCGESGSIMFDISNYCTDKVKQCFNPECETYPIYGKMYAYIPTSVYCIAFRNWANNNLQEVQSGAFSGLENSLQTVDLSSNQLSYFPALTELNQLTTLDLSSNDIEHVEFEAFELAPDLGSLYV